MSKDVYDKDVTSRFLEKNLKGRTFEEAMLETDRKHGSLILL